MGTLTSRLKLLKPDPLEKVNVLTHINANFDRLDSGGNGAYVCTSTTRPNGNNFPLFEGMLIYETDTGLLYEWTLRSGGKWVPIVGNKGWELADERGVIGSNSSPSFPPGRTEMRYRLNGDTCHFIYYIDTTGWNNYGSGAYGWPLPNGIPSKNNRGVVINATSVTPYGIGMNGRIYASDRFYIYNAGTALGQTNIQSWAGIYAQGTYEVAL